MIRFLFVTGLIGLVVAPGAGAAPPTRHIQCGFPEAGGFAEWGSLDLGLHPDNAFSAVKGAVKRVTLRHSVRDRSPNEIFDFDPKGRLTRVTSGSTSYQVYEYDSDGRLIAERSVRRDGDTSGVLGYRYVYFERAKAQISFALEDRKKGWEVTRGAALIDKADGETDCILAVVSRYTAFADKYVLSKDRTTWKQASAVGSQLATGARNKAPDIVANNEAEARERILPLIDCLHQNTCGTSGPRKSAADAGVPTQRAFGVMKTRDGDLDKFTTYWGEMWFKDGLVHTTDNQASQMPMIGGRPGRQPERVTVTYRYALDARGNWTRREKFVNAVKSEDETVAREIEYYK